MTVSTATTSVSTPQQRLKSDRNLCYNDTDKENMISNTTIISQEEDDASKSTKLQGSDQSTTLKRRREVYDTEEHLLQLIDKAPKANKFDSSTNSRAISSPPRATYSSPSKVAATVVSLTSTPLRRSPRKRNSSNSSKPSSSVLSLSENSGFPATPTLRRSLRRKSASNGSISRKDENRQSPLESSTESSADIKALKDHQIDRRSILAADETKTLTKTGLDAKEAFAKVTVNEPRPYFFRKPGKSILRKRSSTFNSSNQNVSANALRSKSAIISRGQLESRIKELFPESFPSVTNMPCVAACLFGCYVLYREHTVLGDHKQQEIPSDVMNEIQPILPLLQLLVELEVSLLRDYQLNGRRVHFAAFDGSAMKPPSDVMQGSHKSQLECIQQLSRVQHEVQHLNNTMADSVLRCLAQFLTCKEFLVGGYSQTCAEILSGNEGNFPAQRVEKAAVAYASDFDLIISKTNVAGVSWNRRLADAAAQLVRYWLRTILNPVPDRAPDRDAQTAWNCRVSGIVHLDSSTHGYAIEDGSLSSLVSNALSHVFDYFGPEASNWQERVAAAPSNFCKTEICLRGIRQNGRKNKINTNNKLTREDWRHVGVQVEMATRYLAALNGADFLYDLFSIIMSENLHRSSWENTVQEAAMSLTTCQASLQNEDAHFLLLAIPPKQLLGYLERIKTLEKQPCQEGLQALSKNFLLGTKKSKTKQKYQPYIEDLERFWEKAMGSTVFPIVTNILEEEDD